METSIEADRGFTMRRYWDASALMECVPFLVLLRYVRFLLEENSSVQRI
jgi:hypothetical protein